MKRIILPLILTTFLLSACVGKNFKKPETELPADQTEQSAENKDEQINKDISAFETEQSAARGKSCDRWRSVRCCASL